MQITAGKIVLFDFALRDADAELIESSAETGPLAFIQGAGQVVRGLEAAMEGHVAGDEFSVVVQPEEGYGLIDENRIIVISRGEIEGGEELEEGAVLQARNEDGDEAVLFVTRIDGDEVTMNGNHPLAGEELHFEIQIREVRDATEDEIERGGVEDDDEE